ncbi:hypothetical protein B0H14DRAFT_2571472 [Mycena olivaceomarginata]|nr:hypothetical protein B0H14DRAFT_2571472 [Mycena olivaceomarginata]
MSLQLNKTMDRSGKKANFFQAVTHNCQFIVIIPPVEQYRSQYITTLEEREVFAFDDDEDSLPSSSSSSPVGSTSSNDVEEVERYLLHGNPRIPRPSDLPPALLGPVKPFFNERISAARKAVDHSLMELVSTQDARGYYIDHPEDHPLAEKPLHILMSGYHEDTTGSLVRTFSNLEHIDTHLGRAIREFHSAVGIPADAWTSMVKHRVTCKSCECVFSYEGYNSHVVDGQCSMASPSKKGIFPLFLSY